MAASSFPTSTQTGSTAKTVNDAACTKFEQLAKKLPLT